MLTDSKDNDKKEIQVDKVKKIVSILKRVIVVLIILAIAGGVFLYIDLRPFLGSDGIIPPGVKKIERELSSNHEYLTLITDYLEKSDCEYIRWEYDSPSVLVYWTNAGFDNEEKEIDEVNVLEAFNAIKDNKFISVTKRNNYVSFTRWISIGPSVSILYCESEPKIDFAGENIVYKLSEENWYYYKYISD